MHILLIKFFGKHKFLIWKASSDYICEANIEDSTILTSDM